VGSLAWLRTPTRSKKGQSKLDKIFDRLVIIKEKLRWNTYVVIDNESKVEISHPINAERLRAYQSGTDLFPGRDKGNKILVEDEEIEAEIKSKEKQSKKEDSEENGNSSSSSAGSEERVDQMPGIKAGADHENDDPVQEELLDEDQENTDEDQWFEVEKLLKMKRVGGINWFLVKWIGGAPNSWQKEGDVSEYLVRQFFVTHTKSGKKRKRRPGSKVQEITRIQRRRWYRSKKW